MLNNIKKELLVFIRILAIIFVVLVITSITCTFSTLLNENKPSTESRCSIISNISEADIIGEWEAGGPDHNDRLIINPDGTYKQVIHIEYNGTDYESDWNPWHVVMSEDGITYLHLTDFAFCGMNSEIACRKRNGGGYDFCKDEYLHMEGEGILLVLATPSGKYIHLHYPLGDENSYAYSLLEQ